MRWSIVNKSLSRQIGYFDYLPWCNVNVKLSNDRHTDLATRVR